MNHPATETGQALEAWLDGVPVAPAPDPAALLPGACDGATAELVFAMLVWEAGVPAAVSAARRLAEQFVDANEMRVALVGELEDTIGLTDAHATDRARLIAGVLNHVFVTLDAVSIDAIARAGAHEAGPFFESLPGTPRFVTDRVMLLAFGEPRMPVDERLRGVLVDRGIVAPELPASAVADTLTRVCPAEHLRALYVRLEAAAGRLVRA